MQLTVGTQNSDRTTLISDATWEEYQNLSIPNCLISFKNGVIAIVSPGRNHEIISDLIRAIIWGYCRKNSLLLFTYNQTRLIYEGKEGKEPDVAYCFEKDKDKPDLAVEVTTGVEQADGTSAFPPVNLTSGSINDLTKYQYLNISEVWVWSQKKIEFFVKTQRGYQSVTVSNCLPNLECDRVTNIVNSSFGKSPLEVEDELMR